MAPTAPLVGGVADFADHLLGDRPGVDLTRGGRASRALTAAARERGHGADISAALIASVFWQSFIAGGAYDRALQLAGVDPSSLGRVDRMIVPHPIGGALVTPRFDLLIFAEHFTGHPMPIEVSPSEDSLETGWRAVKAKIAESGFPQDDELDLPSFAYEHFDLVREASGDGEFQMLIAQRPEVDMTGAPNPAWPARETADAADFATAGVVARNRDGVLGVTIPNHLFCREAPRPTPVGTEVSIRGLSCRVVSCDLITDSCFVALPLVEEGQGVVGLISGNVVFQVRDEAPFGDVEGAWSGAPPGHGAGMTFTGALSEVRNVTVSGYDPFIWVPSKHVARCLYTSPGTGQGDSGAALVGGDPSRVAGFAFERSAFDAEIEWSSWIWAEAVLRAHGLTLMSERRPQAKPVTSVTL